MNCESESLSPPMKSSRLHPHQRIYLSRDHACASSFEERATSEAGLTDRRIGLNMNYSTISTEISSYPESSILLQIILIINNTIRIIPEFDREGLAVCLFWLESGQHNETPTDKKKLVPSRVPSGDLRTPQMTSHIFRTIFKASTSIFVF